jgi:hypothetical protein
MALGLIKLSVDSTIRQEASRHSTPLAFFNWCKEQFTPKQEIYLQDLFEQFWETSLAKLPNMQAYINKLKSTRERIIGAGGTLDDEQMKAKMMGSLTDQYAHFKTAYRLMPRAEKETIDQISQLLISEEHTRSSARLEKKNVVHYISSNRQSGFGSPQTSSLPSKDRCKTCMCLHKGECHVKTGKIPNNWSAAKKARIQERIDQFKKHGKVTVANAIDAKDEGPKEQSHKKKRKHIYVSLLDVNGAIGRNGAIDVAKEANGLNAAIEEANGLNAAIEETDELNAAIEETTDPMDIDQSSISDSKHEFEPGRH